MYYIKSQPSESGNHGNPVSNRAEGMVALPDELISAYIETMGFAFLTIADEVVTAVAINQEAYDTYQESVPEPEEEPVPITQEELEETMLDHEYRILLLEYGLNAEEDL